MRKGFTLIELLVVIAIIAILAAILFPVFARARKAANTTKCLVHGQELAKAMMSYMDDNNGRFPSAATTEMLAKFANITWRYHWPAFPPGYDFGWGVDLWGVNDFNQYAYIQLASYVKNTDIWRCPAPEGLYGLKYSNGFRNSWFFRTGNPGVAGYPDAVFWESREISPKVFRNIGLTIPEVQMIDSSKYKRFCPPSKKFFAWCYSTGVPVNNIDPGKGGSSGKVFLVTPYYAHNEGSIFIYLDGHAKYREIGSGFAPVHYTDHPADEPHPRS